MIESLFDFLLAPALLAVAAIALHSRELFRAVVLFIVFGLLMALAWVRLNAPDIALAEAAIGAGLTGALLLDAVSQLGEGDEGVAAPIVFRSIVVALMIPFTLMLGAAVWLLPEWPGGLTAAAAGEIAASGVSHPVTAVLLNYRAYDTWLEIAVLLVAVIAVLAVSRSVDYGTPAPTSVASPLLAGSLRRLLPMMLLAAGYLLARGTHAPGGAFQAGAMLGAVGVLLLYAGYRPLSRLEPATTRILLAAGVISFFLAVAASLFQPSFLQLDPLQAGWIILTIEAAVALSIGLTLTALFGSVRSAGRDFSGEVKQP
jgi:multisubunit Na+/H+ antiporter MnhB subunit